MVWSSITWGGGGGGGASEVSHLQKGGTGKVLAILKWGHEKCLGSFNTGA